MNKNNAENDTGAQQQNKQRASSPVNNAQPLNRASGKNHLDKAESKPNQQPHSGTTAPPEPSAAQKAEQVAAKDLPAELRITQETLRARTQELNEAKVLNAQLQTQKQELNEALLRKQADFENYRRRMQKNQQDAIQFANSGLMKDLLEVLDNFDRALVSHQDEKDSSPAMKALFEGLELVEKQLTEILESRYGLKPVKSVGQEFDPNCHEALTIDQSGDYAVPTVVEELRKGYLLHGRVLRPAQVKVAQAKVVKK